MSRLVVRRLALAVVLLMAGGCAEPAGERASQEAPHEQAPPLFERLPAQRTGIDFANTLSERPEPQRTELLFQYFANGAGVAAGDLDGDGLDDLFFTGNMSYNRLYLNRGGMRFEDVTEAAGVAGRRNTWKTGVTMADVDGDGLLDLYVCYSGDLPLDRRVDELYINQGPGPDGVPRFEERAEAYGLAQPHSSNQAYFFDYDRDGDLDLFLHTHNVKSLPRQQSGGDGGSYDEPDPVSGVRFYENRGGRFEDVTDQAGLHSTALTYGLGTGVSDLDGDGWLDLYVGNDYAPPDYLYMNDGDGTFTDEMSARMGHTSHASMGVDVADINNDARPDVVVVDMLAEDNRRQKLMYIPDNRASFERDVRAGFHHQYMRNTLQLNNGDGSFSEVGQLAGVSNTDWSWAPLLADYDLDGYKDLFVTNGILHDVTNRDFMKFKFDYTRRRNYDLEPQDVAYLMERMPSTDLRNYAFRNGGDLRFEDVSEAWGLDAPVFSAGAAYADLDADGDLDLVTSNVNTAAHVYENRAADRLGRSYLAVALRGAGANTAGIGASVTLHAGGQVQYLEQMPARGYLSAVTPVLHFGLGTLTQVDSLRVTWPDGRTQVLRDVATNQRLVIRQEEAAVKAQRLPVPEPVFEEVASPLPFTHRAPVDVDDFRRQPLMVNPKSLAGPPLAQADVDGDGLDDVYAGGGSGQPGQLYLQRPGGRFEARPQAAFAADAASDDVDALFFDADGDGALDLYVASGGYGRYQPGDEALRDRLYRGDGTGRFAAQPSALPERRAGTGAVAAGDADGDGDSDLFVGGHVVPGRYPEHAPSTLLLNDGTGHFREAPLEEKARRALGMVSDAQWHDLDGDGTPELVVVGEWMPIRVFEAADGRLEDVSASFFDGPTSGLWNTVRVSDVTGDGRADVLAGNFGLNAQLRAGPERPAELHYADFDRDGTVDPLLTFYVQGVSYPFLTLDELNAQMPRVARRFSSHAQFAEATLEDILSEEERAQATTLEARHLQTSLFVGTPTGRLVESELPVQAQFAPVLAADTLDYDRDGRTDLLLAGNVGVARIRLGKYDANYGVLLRGLGAGRFAYVPQWASGLSLRGDVRSTVRVGDTFLFGTHGAATQAYRLKDRQ